MEEVKKKYVTKLVEYSPKADTTAMRVEKMANEMADKGYEMVTFSCTATGRGFAVFRERT